MLKVLSNILCDLDPKVNGIGQKAGICDGVPSTSALVFHLIFFILGGNQNIHKSMDKFEFRSDTITDYRVSCFRASEKFSFTRFPLNFFSDLFL